MIRNILRRMIVAYRYFLNTRVSNLLSKTPFLSAVYYLLFSSKFRREQNAVLRGKAKHIMETSGSVGNMFTLIRNIHRIEKGLLMKPRRNVFALDFIKETVDNYISLENNKTSQMKWAKDVLTEYFLVTGSNNVIEKQRKRFNDNNMGTDTLEEVKAIPYIRIEENKPSISFEDFYKLTKYRRSVRWFLDKKVPHDLIDKALLSANQSPSACNRQPYEFRVIDDKEKLKQVLKLPMGARGYDHNVPMVIVVVGNLDAYFDERDRHVIYIDGSLASMSLMLALETLGLSSCCINWPDVEVLEIKMEKVLSLEKHQRPIMCLAVGYPDPKGKVAFSEKKDLNQLRKYN